MSMDSIHSRAALHRAHTLSTYVSGKTIPLPAGIKYVEEHAIGKAYLFDQNWSMLEAKLVDVIEEDSFNLQKRFDKALGASPSLCLFIFSLLDSWSSIDC